MIIDSRISQSPTLVFAEAAQKRKNEGKDVISMGIGEPDIKVPDFLVNAVIESVKKQSTSKYLNSLGNLELRSEISDYLVNVNMFYFTKEQIMITAGAKQAIQLILFALLKPNDEVIYFSPSYVSYLPQILLADPNAVPVSIPLKEDFEFDIEQLQNKINKNTKVILLNSPHNPTGKIFTKEQQLAVCKLALSNNIFLVLDDVYEHLIYDNKDYFSPAQLQELSEIIFYVNSFSKSHSIPGWRIGYLAAPKSCLSTLIKIQQHMQTNTCSLVQDACVSIYKNGFDFLKAYSKVLASRADYIFDELSPVFTNPLFRPQGGFFYFINISEFNLNSNEFCAKLIDETGVALTPGKAFGDDWDHFVRLSFGVEDQELKEGISRLKLFLQKLRS